MNIPRPGIYVFLVVILIAIIVYGFLNLLQDSDSEPQQARGSTSSDIEWVHIKGGCFQMGESRIYPEEGKPQEACVDPFWISKTEVTNAQYAAFADKTGYLTDAEKGHKAADPDGLGIDLPPGSMVFSPNLDAKTIIDWWKYKEQASWRNPSGERPLDMTTTDADRPVVHVTFDDAAAFAGHLDARLPSEAEWEYAARGGLDGKLYAWDEVEEAALKDKANTWQGIFPVMNSKDDGFEGMAPAGSFPPNRYGLYDMIGNVWELTASAYYPRHGLDRLAAQMPQGVDPNQPGRPVHAIKGGSYLCAKSYCYRYRPAARQAQDANMATNHIGFRIVRETSP